MNILLNVAYAADVATGAAGDPSSLAGSMGKGLLPIIGIFVVMYLIMILPQKKREKKVKEMINSVSVGDNIVTIGGIIGKVVNVKEEEITIETSLERTKINFKKWAIKEVVKPTDA